MELSLIRNQRRISAPISQGRGNSAFSAALLVLEGEPQTLPEIQTPLLASHHTPTLELLSVLRLSSGFWDAENLGTLCSLAPPCVGTAALSPA